MSWSLVFSRWSLVVSYWLISVIVMLAMSNTAVSSGYEECFNLASKKYGVSKEILKAIAFTESKMQPYAVNVNGKGYVFSDLRKAFFFLKNNLEKNPDIGIMQINYKWFRVLHIPFWYGLDPCYSIMLGAYILRRKIDKYGDNWFGIAAYHSVSKRSNILYAWRLYRNLKKIAK